MDNYRDEEQLRKIIADSISGVITPSTKEQSPTDEEKLFEEKIKESIKGNI